MALGEITVAWLGNFGTLPFFGPGDFPAWGPLPRPQDAVRQPHFVHLSQPPPGTLKLRFYWGNEDSSGLITFSMVEFNMPDPPPGFEQQFVGLDPPGPGKVELQIDVNVGPTLPGGPDMQYWRLMATAGDFLGTWWADTNEWHENPTPAPPTPGRTWTYQMLRTPASWWAVTAVYPLGSAADCPPIPRPPWPYSSSTVRLAQLSMARRALKRRISGASQGSAQFRGQLAAINDARARYLAAKQQQQN
jgi:hypothetical protein